MEEEKNEVSEEQKRLSVIRMVLSNRPTGSDMEYATKQASILYDYIYNNKLTTKNK